LSKRRAQPKAAKIERVLVGDTREQL
jgi:hypothetical protein